MMEAVNFIFYGQKDFQPVGGKVVSYFYDSFFALWKSGIDEDLRTALRNHPQAEIWASAFIHDGSLGWLLYYGT